jgi:hypothetical protein
MALLAQCLDRFERVQTDGTIGTPVDFAIALPVAVETIHGQASGRHGRFRDAAG